MRLPVNTVIHTTLVGLEPAIFRSLVRRAASSATEPTEAGTRPIRAAEIEAVSLLVGPINVFLTLCSKCEMSDKRLMLAKPLPCKKVRNAPEDTLNVVGSHTVIEANDSAHCPIERCQVVNAEGHESIRTRQRERNFA